MKQATKKKATKKKATKKKTGLIPPDERRHAYEIYLDREKREWDGKQMIYSELLRKYFATPDAAIAAAHQEFADGSKINVEGLSDQHIADTLRLMLCEQQYPRWTSLFWSPGRYALQIAKEPTGLVSARKTLKEALAPAEAIRQRKKQKELADKRKKQSDSVPASVFGGREKGETNGC